MKWAKPRRPRGVQERGGCTGQRKLLGRGILGQGYWGLYLFKELIHKVVPIHMDHLLFIITVFCLGTKQGQVREQSLSCPRG